MDARLQWLANRTEAAHILAPSASPNICVSPVPDSSDMQHGRGAEAAAPRRGRWIQPAIAELPRLIDLTLQTGSGIPGDGDTGGGGSTVIP